MMFVSERVINISELESFIESARVNFEILEMERKKAAPSKEVIESAAEMVKKSLEKAKRFEFHIEKRMCCVKELSGNPKFEENHADVDNRK